MVAVEQLVTNEYINYLQRSIKIKNHKCFNIQTISDILKETLNVSKIKSNYLIVKATKQNVNTIKETIENTLVSSLGDEVSLALDVKQQGMEVIVRMTRI